jgi:hypothetical protein
MSVGSSLCRHSCTTRWRSWPALTAVTAKYRAKEYDDWEEDGLHRQRDEEAGLRASMPSRDVSDVEDRRPLGRAMVQHLEHRLKISIEIHGWPDNALEYERIVSVIPPAMGSAWLEDRGLPRPGPYLASIGCGGQSAGDHPELFGFAVVQM